MFNGCYTLVIEHGNGKSPTAMDQLVGPAGLPRWNLSVWTREIRLYYVVSMDWFKEMLQENSMFYGKIMENLYIWFPVAFPLNHSIDSCNTNPSVCFQFQAMSTLH